MGFTRSLYKLEVRFNVGFVQVGSRGRGIRIRTFNPSGSGIAPAWNP
jgi:hypothetical protein